MSLELMNETRIFCLQLMRTEELALWEKLATLDLFCESLTNTLNNNGPAAILPMLESFISIVENNQIPSALAELQPDYLPQARLFSTFWQTKSEDHFFPAQQKSTISSLQPWQQIRRAGR